MNANDHNWNFDVAEKAFETGVIDWGHLLELFPVLDSLKHVEQNPEYHKEGNVLNHTKLAVEQLVDLAEWKAQEPWRRSALFLAVLLHDIGKIDTTVEQDGVLKSSGHSANGARLIRQILWDYNRDGIKVPFAVREYVSTMALLHMLPMHLLDKEDPLYSVCASSLTLCNRDLAILAEADTRGRMCDGVDNALSALTLFKDFCAENECYLTARKFQSDHARFLYFFERVGHPDLDRYHDRKGTVHMLSGLPGAGKDTYIKKHLPALPVVSLDDIRDEMDVKPRERGGEVFQLARERCREHMRDGRDFVFNATNFIKQTRSRWVRLFHQYNYQIEMHYIEPSFTVLMRQNLNREKSVPESVVRGMFKKIEPPTLLECYKLHQIV